MVVEHVPYYLVVHTEITMDEHVPHPGHLLSIYLKMGLFEIIWDLLRGLTDYLHGPFDGPSQGLVVLVPVKGQSFRYIYEVFAFVPYMFQIFKRLLQ